MDKAYNKIKKYLNYEFSTGCTTGEDYKEFERKYINYLKKLCESYGWELIKPHKGHYELSAFIKKKEEYVYLSISDVRFFPNEWHDHILVRTAKNENDYHGGRNHYSTISYLPVMIHRLFVMGD